MAGGGGRVSTWNLEAVESEQVFGHKCKKNRPEGKSQRCLPNGNNNNHIPSLELNKERLLSIIRTLTLQKEQYCFKIVLPKLLSCKVSFYKLNESSKKIAIGSSIARGSWWCLEYFLSLVQLRASSSAHIILVAVTHSPVRLVWKPIVNQWYNGIQHSKQIAIAFSRL